MFRDWKSRAGRQRRPAPFVVPAVIVDFRANIGIHGDAANRNMPFHRQPVAVTPGIFPSDRPEVYTAPIRDKHSNHQGKASRCFQDAAMFSGAVTYNRMNETITD